MPNINLHTSPLTPLLVTNDGTVTTILGPTGDYNRIGDAGTTSRSLASEDDLLVTGILEVDGGIYADAGISSAADFNFLATARWIKAHNADNGYLIEGARDSTVGVVEVSSLRGGADPWFQIGRDDTGVATDAVTDMLVLQAGAGTGNESANFGLGISAKLGNASSEVEERVSLDAVLTTATNGSEAAEWRFGAMTGGAMVADIFTVSGAGADIGVSANMKRFHDTVTLDTGDAETAVGLTPAAVLLSAAIRVSTEIAGLDSADHHIQLGINGTSDKYIDVAQGSSATTISANKKGSYTFDPTDGVEASALVLTITGGSDNTPSAGAVEVEVVYLDSSDLADV